MRTGDSSRIENAEEAWENTTEGERSEEPTSQESSGTAEEGRKEMENPPPWIPDVMAPKCMTCEAVFTLVRRRHHCRNCGKVGHRYNNIPSQTSPNVIENTFSTILTFISGVLCEM